MQVESDVIRPEIIKLIPIYEEDKPNVEDLVFGIDYETDFIPGTYFYEAPTDSRIPLDDDTQRHIQDICERYDIDVNLVYSICEHESRYTANACNGSCKGIMQMNTSCHKMDDPFDIEENVEAGCKYLRDLLDEYSLETTLAIWHGESDALTKRTPSKYTRKIIERRDELAKQG